MPTIDTKGSSTTSIGGGNSRFSSASRRATRSAVGGWERSSEGCGMRRAGTGNIRSSQNCP